MALGGSCSTIVLEVLLHQLLFVVLLVFLHKLALILLFFLELTLWRLYLCLNNLLLPADDISYLFLFHLIPLLCFLLVCEPIKQVLISVFRVLILILL